jgi:hypothetical protein
VNSTLCEYKTAQGYTLAGDGPSRARQVRQQGQDLGTELNRAAPSARSPPFIAKPTYSTPTKNLCASCNITSELVSLQDKELREKQARLQELLNTADLQQQAIEPDGEASSTRCDNCLVVAGQNKPQAQQASSPNKGRVEHSRSNRAPSKSGGNHRTQHSGYHSRQPRDPAVVTSKPCNPPQPNAAELAWGKAVAHAVPAPRAGHGAQVPQPALSLVSLRVGKRVDPLKDDALVDSKLDEEESSMGPICSAHASATNPFCQSSRSHEICPSTPEQ